MKPQQITLSDVPGYIQELQVENEILRGKVVELEPKAVIFDKYYNVEMTTSEVAKLHDIHEATVRKYVNLGLIPTHPKSSDSKMLIRGSIGLTLDFDLLRRKSQLL